MQGFFTSCCATDENEKEMSCYVIECVTIEGDSRDFEDHAENDLLYKTEFLWKPPTLRSFDI